MKKSAICIFLTLCSACLACWIDIPLDQFIRESPVVIKGRIVEIKSAPKQKYGYDTAYIMVEEILKNSSASTIRKGQKVELIMPSTNNETLISTDIHYPLEADGYWILREDGGRYKADYPKAYQEIKMESEVRRALERSTAVKFEMKK
jgi:hypothetical protein